MNTFILEELGMTNYEAKLYFTLLYNPQISAYELAEKAGLYRQATYDALKRLQEKGFVSASTQGRTKLYTVLDPKLLLDLFQEKVDKFSQTLPELNKVYKQEDISVQTFTGSHLLRLAFKDVLNKLQDGGEILISLSDESSVVKTKDDELAVEYYEHQILERNIKEKVLLNEGVEPVLVKGSSQYKFIPKKFANDVVFQVFADTVHLLLFNREPAHLIIIKDKETADSYRNQFNFMWAYAKK